MSNNLRAKNNMNFFHPNQTIFKLGNIIQNNPIIDWICVVMEPNHATSISDLHFKVYFVY